MIKQKTNKEKVNKMLKTDKPKKFPMKLPKPLKAISFLLGFMGALLLANSLQVAAKNQEIRNEVANDPKTWEDHLEGETPSEASFNRYIDKQIEANHPELLKEMKDNSNEAIINFATSALSFSSCAVAAYASSKSKEKEEKEKTK